MEAPPAGWTALLDEDPGAAPAQQPTFLRALSEVVPGMRAEFVAVEREETLIGGCAVVVERRGGLHWIHALPFLLPGAPLARPGQHRAVDLAVAQALNERARELRAVGGEWAIHRACGPDMDPEALARVGGETRMLETTMIGLDRGLEPAWRAMTRDLRTQIRRVRGLGLTFQEEPAALREAYALHRTQARAWPGHQPLPLELSHRLLASGEPPPARLFTVRDGRGVLSATLALVHSHEVFLWWSGTHPDGRRLHAFPLLLWSVAEWAAAAGCSRVNLGGSGVSEALATFKHQFKASSCSYPVRWLDARHAGPLGRWVAAVQRVRRRGRTIGNPV